MVCPTCRRHCREQALDRTVDGVTWRCPVKACKKRFGIRHGSFFEKSHLQLWQFLGLTYLWCRIAGKSRRVSVEDAQHELQIGSEHSIVYWNQYCRDIAVSHFVNNPVQIGCPGHIVEIDESLFSRRKYNRGRIVPEQWIFGRYDPATKEDFSSLIYKPTCYKNFDKPKCIDLILTNKPSYFQHSNVFETGLSDFHLLTATEFKMGFQKLKPQVITYRNYKNFNNDRFQADIKTGGFDTKDINSFKETILSVFSKYAPIKKKYIRANEAPFMTKNLHKEIMKRSRLRNKYLKSKSLTDRKNYNVQRNFCKKLLRTTKKEYFNNLDTKKITDNKRFWRTVVPTFSNNNLKSDKIILNEEGKTISDEKELCRTFSTYFANIVSDLQIPKIQYNAFDIKSNHDPVLAAINTFQNHPSVFNIKQREFNSTFTLKTTNENEVRKTIKTLNVRKTCQGSDIPTKIIKLNIDLFSGFICQNFYYCISIGKFPNELKHADVIPVHKKNDKSDKTNYRPVSILPNISKIYEKIIYNQLYEYFHDKLFPSQCGFRKGYSSQHSLLVMTEKFKESIDKGNAFGALLTDLSKAFDCIDHTLLIAKLSAFGVSPLSLKLLDSYLSNRTQRIKINGNFSDRTDTEFGVPQGSILGPILFNIYLIDLFYECEDSSVASYADDTAPYSCATDIASVALELQASATKLFLWFKNNHLKANPGKSHILLSSKKPEIVSVDGISIAASPHEKLLGVTIDSELKFENHITEICHKVSKKINALSRISSFMSLEKRRTLMKAFIEYQFNYCPLIWMFHSRTLNNKINRIHERALRTVYSDYNSSFNELLDKDGSFTIHQRNVQSLAIEIYKYLHGLSPAILNEVFKVNETIPYDLRMRNELYARNSKTVRYGTETINYSYIIYLEFVLTFKIYRQLTLIGFTLYCNSYVKVNRK